MIRLLVDENFNRRILEGLIEREPELDVVRVRDAGLEETPDPVILEWAATHNRVLLTHDRETIPFFALARVRAREPMPGVFLVRDGKPIGRIIDDLRLAIHALSQEECQDMIRYFPV